MNLMNLMARGPVYTPHSRGNASRAVLTKRFRDTRWEMVMIAIIGDLCSFHFQGTYMSIHHTLVGMRPASRNRYQETQTAIVRIRTIAAAVAASVYVVLFFCE